jgi:glycosyltransferase involved in cell wall biosynthesis
MITLALISSHAPSLAYFRGPLIKALSARGVTVLALAPNYDDKSREAVKNWGGVPMDCAMNRTGMNPLIDILNTWRLTRQLRHLKPDAFMGYFVKPVIFGTLAASWARVPRKFSMIEGLGFVFTNSSESISLSRRVLKFLVKNLYRVALSKSDCAVFLNPDDLSEFVELGLVSKSKTFLLGGIGVDLNDWSAVPPTNHPVTFLLVARLLREKGVMEFAAAARLIKQMRPQAHFVLLGGLDDNPGAIAEAEVRGWVAEGLLDWHGHVEVRPWMKKASVYVLPSYREGVPVSTQEALAMGRAVITTDVPGCRETVRENENGFLVKPRDAQALADKMLLFIDNPDLISSMGIASRKFAEEKFDIHAANKRLMDLILSTSDIAGEAR